MNRYRRRLQKQSQLTGGESNGGMRPVRRNTLNKDDSSKRQNQSFGQPSNNSINNILQSKLGNYFDHINSFSGDKNSRSRNKKIHTN